MVSLQVALILALAVAYTTYVVTTARITEPVRLALYRRRLTALKARHEAEKERGEDSLHPDFAMASLAELARTTGLPMLISCPWCASPYIATVAYGVYYAATGSPPTTFAGVLGALALIAATAYVTGFLATISNKS
ncbi:hypothetical protein [Streptomyces sp. NPDC087300]|uniref:hypothetical protein n=1 Tax=Streptomyces sp. NPDC087300 TaxID=3365780 RepID=UPI0037F162D7